MPAKLVKKKLTSIHEALYATLASKTTNTFQDESSRGSNSHIAEDKKIIKLDFVSNGE